MTNDNRWADWEGRTSASVAGPYPVSVASIGYLAEAVEDVDLAERIAKGEDVTAPSSFVTVATRIPNWRPLSTPGPASLMQALEIPLPADSAVNVAIDQRYHARMRPGDTVTSQSTILSVVPKTTRLGDGHMIREEIRHWNQYDILVAQTINTMFRFRARSVTDTPATSGGTRPSAAPPEPPITDLPPITMPITMTKLTVAAGGVRDMSPLHHDPELARANGHPTAFLSYSFQQALAVRAIRDWFGDDERLRRLSLVMKAPAYLGRTLTCVGKSADACTAESDSPMTIDLTLQTEDGVCSTGIAELGKPGGSE